VSGSRGLVLGDGRLRMGPWRGDATTAYVLPGRGHPSPGAVARCVEEVRRGGFRRAVTAALAGPEQAPFLAAGFDVHERLHLLSRHLHDLPPDRPPDGHGLRRARRADRPALLAVDHAAFPHFWRLDLKGLDDAMAATPSARLRVATDGAGAVVGYAISGRAGQRGYLQRLAVHPRAQGLGVGTALISDSLRWLRRRGARQVLVNTQESNARAVRLYQRLGFVMEPQGLAVLHLNVGAG